MGCTFKEGVIVKASPGREGEGSRFCTPPHASAPHGEENVRERGAAIRRGRRKSCLGLEEAGKSGVCVPRFPVDLVRRDDSA